jgi:hypothetical protein
MCSFEGRSLEVRKWTSLGLASRARLMQSTKLLPPKLILFLVKANNNFTATTKSPCHHQRKSIHLQIGRTVSQLIAITVCISTYETVAANTYTLTDGCPQICRRTSEEEAVRCAALPSTCPMLGGKNLRSLNQRRRLQYLRSGPRRRSSSCGHLCLCYTLVEHC